MMLSFTSTINLYCLVLQEIFEELGVLIIFDISNKLIEVDVSFYLYY